MPTFEELDAITLESLLATKATRWTDPNGAIGAFTAEMDYGVAPEIIAALHDYVDGQLFGYTPPKFIADMQEAQADFLNRRYGWAIAPEHIHPVGDVLKALEEAMRHFANGSKKIIVPTPAYMPFLFLPPQFGYEVVEVPMLIDEGGAFRYDLEALDVAFREAGGGLLLHCDPHNPTGRMFTLDELQALEEVVARNGARVFSDEIWAPLTRADQRHIPYASISERAAGHTVTSMSASKGWNLPGLKCAQLITSNDADLALWAEVGPLPEHTAGTPGILANTVAFREGEAWVDDICRYLGRNARALREFLAEELPDVWMPVPESTYVVWLDLRAYDLQPSPAEYVKEHANVILTEGTKCGRIGEGHVRFIFSMPYPVMMEALRRIAAALKDAPRAA